MSYKRQNSERLSVSFLILVFLFGVSGNVIGDSPVEKDQTFLEKATQQAVRKVRSGVVNVRPIQPEKAQLTFEEAISELKGTLQRRIDQNKKQLGQEGESEEETTDESTPDKNGGKLKKKLSRQKKVLKGIQQFFKISESYIQQRHKEAFRDLYLRVGPDTDLFHRLLKVLNQVGRGFQDRLGINDALDFLQYIAPPPSGYAGVMISQKYVLTSRFAVLGKGNRFQVYFEEDKKMFAKEKGTSKPLGVALLSLEEEPEESVETVSLDNSTSHLELGYWAIVVGRGPEPGHITATRGVVSGTDRAQGRKLQLDALANYGNTGGAVVDISGNFIGLVHDVTIRNALQIGHNSGVTMAAKPDAIQEVLPQLKSGQSLGVPFLGVSPDLENSPKKGVRILRVVDKSGAGKAGMQSGDVILEFNKMKILEWRDLVNAIRQTKIGKRVEITIRRDEERKRLDVKLTGREQYEN